MLVGDLVEIKKETGAPFFIRPKIGSIGIIVEIQYSSYLGTIYYVYTTDGIWKFSEYEVEMLNGSG